MNTWLRLGLCALILIGILTPASLPGGLAGSAWEASPVTVSQSGGAWSGLFTVRGASSTVLATLVGKDGSLYIGGALSSVGEAAAGYGNTGVYRWSGGHWTVLGNQIITGQITSLAMDDAGTLYAAGSFTVRREVPGGYQYFSYIARWDGTLWQPLGDSTLAGARYSERIYAMVLGKNGLVYIGGDFTRIGSVDANRLAAWNGSVWSALGAGTGPMVKALAYDAAHDLLYAGGDFNTAGGATVYGVARWDGHAWADLGGGMTDTVYALAVEPLSSDLYAGGAFLYAGNKLVLGVARWNGSTWSALGGGLAGLLPPNEPEAYALLADGQGGVYVGGNFLQAGGVTVNNVGHWNGSAWSAVGTGLGVNSRDVSRAMTLARTPDGTLYAGGYFITAGGGVANNIARWNGSAWTALGSGLGLNDEVHALLRLADGSLVAGGKFQTAGGLIVNCIARWDGARWHAYGAGVCNYPGYGVDALAVAPDGALYAAGAMDRLPTAALMIARWTGSAWVALGPGTASNIYALATDSHGNLYAGGVFDPSSGQPGDSLARWDGSAWNDLGGTDGGVYALAVDSQDHLFVGGFFDHAGSLAARNIARWDGAWHILGAGLDSQVYALSFDDQGNLVAAGDFTHATGQPASGVARWNGTAWADMGITTMPRVEALARDLQGNLLAGGMFTWLCTDINCNTQLPYYHVMRSYGSTGWMPLGETGANGVDQEVKAVAVAGAGQVFVGGFFARAGAGSASGLGSGLASPNLAMWTAPQASLQLNYSGGGPGSYFSVTASAFPPGSQATVLLNGQTLLSGLAVDSQGNLSFRLATPAASPGLYRLTVRVNPQATAYFTIDPSLPVRPSEGSGPQLDVPAGTALRGLFLPLLAENQP